MSRRIATLRDLQSDDSDNHPPRDGQAFYAGGSEHSGQQILGPNRGSGPNNSQLIDQLFHQARQSAALVSDPSQGSQSTGGSAGPATLPIVFWRNGFTVGESELRDYEAIQNRDFIDHLRRGETPPELARQVRGGMVEVKLENKATQDYKSERKVQAFSGRGYRLGAPAPETVSKPETD